MSLQSLKSLWTSGLRRYIAMVKPPTAEIMAADNRFSPLVPQKSSENSQRSGVLAFKSGMMSHYDKWGYRHPVTVLDLSDCQVLGSFRVGRSIIQEVGIGEKSARQCHTAQLKYYADLKLPVKLHKRGFSVTPEGMMPPGTFLRAAHFVPGQMVDVQAKSIGKGFQGAMKKWGFGGQPASHGTSLSHRAIGCTGARSQPGRVFKGKKMAGRMGGNFVTVMRLRILKIDHALNCIFVRGAVPGHDNTVVKVTDAKTTRRQMYRENRVPFPTYIQAEGAEPLPREQTAEYFDKDPLFVGVAESTK